MHATTCITLNSPWAWAKDGKGLFVFDGTNLKQVFLFCLPLTQFLELYLHLAIETNLCYPSLQKRSKALLQKKKGGGRKKTKLLSEAARRFYLHDTNDNPLCN